MAATTQQTEQQNEQFEYQHLYLKVRSREGLVFDSEVESVSGVNDDGKFDVLRSHAKFISIIKGKLTVRLLDGVVREIPVDNAVMRVKGEEIQVFLGIKQA